MSCEALVELLKKHYDRILCEKQDGQLLIVILSEVPLMLCIYSKVGRLYARLLRLESASTMNCAEAIAEARGLYLFAKNLSELVVRVREKAKRFSF
ncbi:MAG: hypothetical protein QXN03_03205 [Desulfurococcaceae archaeon]